MKRSLRLVPLGLCLLTWGCGPPQAVEVLPPGFTATPAVSEAEQAEALGETGMQGTIQQPTAPIQSELVVAPPTDPGKLGTLPSGLKYETIKAGSGAEAKPGQEVKFHYTGALENGQQVDTSRGGQPYAFRLGVSQNAIQGWHQGIAGMRVGEVRKLTIPSSLAYGPEGRAPIIPPNATLLYEIELVGVE